MRSPTLPPSSTPPTLFPWAALILMFLIAHPHVPNLLASAQPSNHHMDQSGHVSPSPPSSLEVTIELTQKPLSYSHLQPPRGSKQPPHGSKWACESLPPSPFITWNKVGVCVPSPPLPSLAFGLNMPTTWVEVGLEGKGTSFPSPLLSCDSSPPLSPFLSSSLPLPLLLSPPSSPHLSPFLSPLSPFLSLLSPFLSPSLSLHLPIFPPSSPPFPPFPPLRPSTPHNCLPIIRQDIQCTPPVLSLLTALPTPSSPPFSPRAIIPCTPLSPPASPHQLLRHATNALLFSKAMSAHHETIYPSTHPSLPPFIPPIDTLPPPRLLPTAPPASPHPGCFC
ncbi:unnamed protein product [Closterium sp. Naga37s-1]|nr:unnamed protein product [Closterium sp. Naga37s-1]